MVESVWRVHSTIGKDPKPVFEALNHSNPKGFVADLSGPSANFV